MRISPRTAGASALAIGLTVTLAACGSGKPSSNSSSSSGKTSSSAYNLGKSGGNKGGVLKALAESDNSSYAPSAVYDTNSAQLARLYARTLYSYESSNDPAKRFPVQPDLADGQPKVSSDGLTYTIKIKDGVKWNIDGTGRQVTAQDAVRGLKLICNPVAPFGASAYFTDSIAGMSDFCDGFGKVDAASAAAVKAYTEDTQVSGIKATDDKTLVVTLKAPTADFPRFISLEASAPAPVESLNYVIDGPDYRQHIISDGPYLLTSYVTGKSLKMVRNPVWDPKTDSLRKAYIDELDLTMGGTPESILQQIQAGTADMTWGDDPIPPASVPGLKRTGDIGLHINPTGGTNPYIVFNFAGGSTAIQKVQVRQAINYAVDKSAISQDLGGPDIFPVLNQIFSQSVVGDGYKQQNLYPSDGNAGNVAKAKELLTAAGYPNGLTVKFSYRTQGNGPKIAATLQASLAKAGINLELKGVPNENYYNDYLQKTAIAKSGDWDMAEPGWGPDWEGASERSYFTPLFDGRTYTDGSTNFGDYNSDAANKLADQALAEQDETKAADLWNQFDAQVMKDAAWVPLVEQNQVNYVGKRVTNFEYMFTANGPDVANLAVQ